MGYISAANDLAFHDFGFPVVLHFKIQDLAFIQCQQQGLGKWIVAVILFQNMQLVGARRIAQHDRIRLYMRRGLGEAHMVQSRLQVERNRLAHNREVLVINRDRQFAVSFFLRVTGKACDLSGRECDHGNTG